MPVVKKLDGLLLAVALALTPWVAGAASNESSGCQEQGVVLSDRKLSAVIEDTSRALKEKENKDYEAAIQAWKNFKAREPRACSSAADSQEFIQLARPKVTVVFLQGYAISPGHMQVFQSMFAEMGVNVLMPRLRGHFNDDPRDLDRVTGEEWIQQSEEVLKIASKMSPKVVVAGYSLGGLLASRLALLYPKRVSALLAFSPAWRTTNLVKTGSAIGSIFGLSANDFVGSVQRCGTYISARGGREVDRVISLTEEAAGGSEYGAANSAFNNISMPSLVATILNDNTVDGSFVTDVRGQGPSTRKATLVAASGDHMGWIYGARNFRPDASPFRGTMSEQIKRFLTVNKVLN